MTAALTVCGCTAKQATLSALPPLPVPPAAAETQEKKEIARFQKPDSPSSANTLVALPVERPAQASHANPTATIRAVVNGEPILDEEVRMSCYEQLRGARTDKEAEEVLRQAVEQIIDREVLLQDAIAKLERGGPQGAKFLEQIKKVASEQFDIHWLKPVMKANHMDNRQEFAAFMRHNHMSLDVMRRFWERNFMAMEYLRSRIEPQISRIGHTEISEYYSSHREEFTQADSVDWQDIFIDATRHASPAAARQFAESLRQRIRQGEDFAKLSQEYDNGESGRFRKGDGQGHKRGEIFPHEAEDVLFQIHEGDIEIIERVRGYHVVRLVKRQHAGPIPFDAKVQKEIRNKLRNNVFQRERDRIVKELKRKAVIEISNKNI
jgi:parvulin-like peptidyl-prolyl isomerase